MRPTLYILTGDAPQRVQALAESYREPGRIVAVDYKGTAHEVPGVDEYIPATGNREDTWFTGQTNTCLRMALERGEEYAVIANDDITIEGDAIGHMVKVMEDNPSIGIIGPVQVDMANPERVTARGFGAAFPTGIHYVGERKMLAGEPKSLRWLTFAFVVYRMKCVQEVGLLDPSLRMWFSDSDYSMRCRLHGWGVYLDEGAIVRHSVHAATSGDSPEAGSAGELGRRMALDQMAFLRKWGGSMLEGMKG